MVSIAFGSDHAAYRDHAWLQAAIKAALPDAEIINFGPHTADPVDYPDVAQLVAQAVASGKCTAGILVCGSGIGVSIAANKVPGVRAALCHDVTTAELSRLHNNANIMCAGVRTTGSLIIEQMISVFLKTSFTHDPRHEKRIQKMTALESKSQL